MSEIRSHFILRVIINQGRDIMSRVFVHYKRCDKRPMKIGRARIVKNRRSLILVNSQMNVTNMMCEKMNANEKPCLIHENIDG